MLLSTSTYIVPNCARYLFHIQALLQDVLQNVARLPAQDCSTEQPNGRLESLPEDVLSCTRSNLGSHPTRGIIGGTLGYASPLWRRRRHAVPVDALHGSKAPEAPSILESADNQSSAAAPSLGRG